MIWFGDLEWYLFGSWALGTRDEYSDLDIMFEGPTLVDLQHPYWVRQREFFEKNHPDVEVWLLDKAAGVMKALTGSSNDLVDPRIIGFICHHRVQLQGVPRLLRLLQAFKLGGGKALIPSQAVFEQRSFFKYTALEDKIAEWQQASSA